MPDKSDPLLDATRRLGGFVWTACESSVPINFLIGSVGLGLQTTPAEVRRLLRRAAVPHPSADLTERDHRRTQRQRSLE